MKPVNKILLLCLMLFSFFAFSAFPFTGTSAYSSDTKHVNAEINAGVWDYLPGLLGVPENLTAGNATFQETASDLNGPQFRTINNSLLAENSLENRSSLNNSSFLANRTVNLTELSNLTNLTELSNLTNTSEINKTVNLTDIPNLTNTSEVNRTVSLEEARNNTGNLSSGGGSGESGGSGGSENNKAILPEANFTSSITSGTAPLNVQFTDLSVNASRWHWDFGDGASSEEKNMVHTYSAAGTYTVTLSASNENGTASKSAEITILERPEVVLPPVAGFTSSVTTGPAPFSVQFTDLSQNASEWHWDFGDGSVSSGQSPAHTYSTAGAYTVTLTVNNTAGKDAEKKAGYIKVGTASSIKLTDITLDGENSAGTTTGSGAFTANPDDSFVQLGVKDKNSIFFNQPPSSGALGKISIPLQVGINEFSLVADGINPGTGNYGAVLFFNGASTSPQVAVYNSNGGTGAFSVQPAGTDVTGSAEGGASSDKAPGSSFYVTPDGTKVEVVSFTVDSKKGLTDEIAGGNPGANGVPDTIAKLSLKVTPSVTVPLASFSASPASGTAPLNVSFIDSSTGSPTSWNWDFGDGTGSTGQNPVHTYSAAGNYKVTLAVSNENGKNSTFAAITVQQPPAPVADYSSSPTSGTATLAVQFTDLSVNAEEWNWDFGDGTGSTGQNPVHTYSTAGNYKVTLTVSSAGGTDSKTGEISVAEKPADDSGNSSSTNSPENPRPVDNSGNDSSTGNSGNSGSSTDSENDSSAANSRNSSSANGSGNESSA